MNRDQPSQHVDSSTSAYAAGRELLTADPARYRKGLRARLVDGVTIPTEVKTRLDEMMNIYGREYHRSTPNRDVDGYGKPVGYCRNEEHWIAALRRERAPETAMGMHPPPRLLTLRYRMYGVCT